MLAVAIPALVDVLKSKVTKVNMENSLKSIRVNRTSGTRMNSVALTYTLSADLAVAFGTLTGEGTDRIDALLAGLTVVFVALALIHVWGRAGVKMRKVKPHCH